MARFDPLLINTFAIGSTHYADQYPGDEQNARIVLTVTPEGGHAIPMILDTGAPWCVLDPELAEAWRLTFKEGYKPTRRLTIRGVEYDGSLVRAVITLQVTHGRDLVVEATIFIPELRPGDAWLSPNFLGLDGFLNRLRFAVDAAENAFYFGSADG